MSTSRRKYQSVLQQGITDCGAACLATIAKQDELRIPIAIIREMSGTDTQPCTLG